MTSVTSDRRQGLNSSAAIKVPCMYATTANIVLSGLQAIDGVVVASGDRILVKNQTNQAENGIYKADTGNWSRDLDFDGAYDVVEGTITTVLHGNTYQGTLWRIFTTNPAVGSALSFVASSLSPTDSNSVTFIQTGSTVARTVQTKERERVSVADFGAVGDGVTDDTTAIQNAINSILTAKRGVLYFPWTGSSYRITTTLKVGYWGWNGNGTNVTGFVGGGAGITFEGAYNGYPNLPATLVWDGTDQPGTTFVVANDTVGNFDLCTDDGAMIRVVGNCSVSFKNFGLDGQKNVNRAFSCIWLEGYPTLYNFDNVWCKNARIGVRNGTRVRHDTYATNYGMAGSPWYKANVTDYTVNGGFPGDSHAYNACRFSGTKYGYSSESAQNLDLAFSGCYLIGGVCPVLQVGGWIDLTSCTFTTSAEAPGAPTEADVWSPSGGQFLAMTNTHSESGATWNVLTSAVASVPNIAIVGGDVGKVHIAGGGARLSIKGCLYANVQRDDLNAIANIDIETSDITGLVIANTGAQENVNINLRACNITVAILATLNTLANGQKCFVTADNCSPRGNLPAWTVKYGGAYESFEGSVHRFYHTAGQMASGAAAAAIGSIDTAPAGNSSSGWCLLKINWVTGVSVNAAGVFGQYSFAWARDSGGNITVSAVRVIAEDKALDTYVAFTPTVTAVVSGTTIQIKLTQTNDLAQAAIPHIVGESLVHGWGGVTVSPHFVPV